MVTRRAFTPNPGINMFQLDLLSPLLLILTGLGLGLLIGWLRLQIWKSSYTREIRQDAVQRSRATISGQVHEQLLPYLPNFPFDPKDVRFLGAPVDLIVFDGLNVGALERIVFVEIKTGGATLTPRERQIREIVQKRRVDWLEMRRDG